MLDSDSNPLCSMNPVNPYDTRVYGVFVFMHTPRKGSYALTGIRGGAASRVGWNPLLLDLYGVMRHNNQGFNFKKQGSI